MSVKDFLGICKDYGMKPIVYASGITFWVLIGLSYVPQYSFVTKYFLLNLLTR